MGLFDFFKKKPTTVDSTVAQTPPPAATPAPEMPATPVPTPPAPGETTPPQQ